MPPDTLRPRDSDLSGGSYELTVECDPSLTDLAFLEERLASAVTAAAAVGIEEEFGVFVRDQRGRVVAGVAGVAWGGCCQLHALWVEEPLRGRGWGRRLMAEAEAEARRRGCEQVMFLAYDLVAPGFYLRHGYETVGVIQGCPRGSATRWYRKLLSQPA